MAGIRGSPGPIVNCSVIKPITSDLSIGTWDIIYLQSIYNLFAILHPCHFVPVVVTVSLPMSSKQWWEINATGATAGTNGAVAVGNSRVLDLAYEACAHHATYLGGPFCSVTNTIPSRQREKKVTANPSLLTITKVSGNFSSLMSNPSGRLGCECLVILSIQKYPNNSKHAESEYPKVLRVQMKKHILIDND